MNTLTTYCLYMFIGLYIVPNILALILTADYNNTTTMNTIIPIQYNTTTKEQIGAEITSAQDFEDFCKELTIETKQESTISYKEYTELIIKSTKYL